MVKIVLTVVENILAGFVFFELFKFHDFPWPPVFHVLKFSGHFQNLSISSLFLGIFWHNHQLNSMSFQAWKLKYLNSMTFEVFHGLYKPWLGKWWTLMTVCLNIATGVVVFFSTGMFTLAMRLWKLAQWAQQSLLEFLGFHQRQWLDADQENQWPKRWDKQGRKTTSHMQEKEINCFP